MVIKHYVKGYEEFTKLMENLTSELPIHVLYIGSKISNGESWCLDCVEAKPFIEKGLKAAAENSHLIYVEVGYREFWNDEKCPFRTDENIKIQSLPTLARWKTQKRLMGSNCLNVDLIEMLLTDNADDE